ncbi:hypothetical protein [Rubinisphaera sp.]|uniref:hypothetical protein n=1 Tax=Rubinisphaera sp. TaxID=2024857 RepID=UPI000C107BD9|nr:hypothetical protein [Rubinisphaera sp.]MBV09006.1 hypothetical protein [Rubinisphaera sp.]HCS53262.1 hypothetical protein [Planctomycetaceae bacterium]|tara:strand:+ start:850 stop:2013 length:1164 start_codon:yes stop_codon:yes gene_type:complete
MTQQEFDWGGSSLLRQVNLMYCHDAERDVLTSLIRLYRRLGPDSADCEYVDGHILLVASKQLMAEQLGCSARTVQRKLQQLSEQAEYVRFKSLGPGRPYLFDLDVVSIMDADRDPDREPATPVANDEPPQSLRDLRDQIMKANNSANNNFVLGRTAPGGRHGPETPETCLGLTQDNDPRHPRQTPYHNHSHSEPYQKNTIHHGDGVLDFDFGFIDLQPREFRDPHAIQKRFEEVLAAGIAKDCISDRTSFFAVMHNLIEDKKVTNPAGLLTQLMRGRKFGKRGQEKCWRQRPNEEDDKQAEAWIRQLDREAREAEAVSESDSLDEWTDEDLIECEQRDDEPDEQKLEPVATVEPTKVSPTISADVAEQLRAATAYHAGRIITNRKNE